VSVPLDLIALGTSLATTALDPAAAELVAALEVPLAAAELVDVVELLLLLLPHAAIAAVLSSSIATETRLFHVRMALLKIEFPAEAWAQDRQLRRIGSDA
jgi:hypothetical protein